MDLGAPGSGPSSAVSSGYTQRQVSAEVPRLAGLLLPPSPWAEESVLPGSSEGCRYGSADAGEAYVYIIGWSSPDDT